MRCSAASRDLRLFRSGSGLVATLIGFVHLGFSPGFVSLGFSCSYFTL